MTDNTKYGDRIADHEWTEPDEGVEQPERTTVKNHEIDVIYTVDPDEDMGYGREKYTAHIRHEDGDPTVLYVVEHRWKGNYWRDTTDWSFLDVPEPVRQRVAAVLPVDSPNELDPETRLMDKDGESRWEKHHRHRMESLDADEMWGTSFLRDAINNLETAAESFDEGSTGEEWAEKLVSVTQNAVKAIEQDND